MGEENDCAMSEMDLMGLSSRFDRRKTSIGQLGLFSYNGNKSSLSSGVSIMVFVKASLKSANTGVPWDSS